MSKLKKAEEFYLRGFGSQYIKRRTGISIQSLLKQLLSKGIKYTQIDIENYQYQYIKARYSDEEIIQAYKDISVKFDDIYLAGRKKQIEVLGCGFGNHAKIFRRLLGDESYNKLKSECWHIKQTKTVQQKYGVSNVFCKETFSNFVSDEVVSKGRVKRTETLIDRYGVEHPNQNVDICNRMLQSIVSTNLERFGVANPMQNPEIAKKSALNRQLSMKEKYGFGNSVEIESIRNSIFESRRKNGTLNTSKPEQILRQLLIDIFGESDVICNKIIDNRYPFHVDFYIKSRDLFIELNGDRCHNDHWFNPNDERDIQILNSWIENMNRLESSTGKKSRYRKYIKTWTDTDCRKREFAMKNGLNYLVFWDGSSTKKGPVLSDAIKWIANDCPDSYDWLRENTY